MPSSANGLSGKRAPWRLAAFVVDDASGEKPATHLTFLPHFFDEPRRKAPAGR